MIYKFRHKDKEVEYEGETIEEAIQNYHYDKYDSLSSLVGVKFIVQPEDFPGSRRESWHLILFDTDEGQIISRVCWNGIFRKGGFSTPLIRKQLWEEVASTLGVRVEEIKHNNWIGSK